MSFKIKKKPRFLRLSATYVALFIAVFIICQQIILFCPLNVFAGDEPRFKIRIDQAVPDFKLLDFNQENVKKLIERIIAMRAEICSTLAARGKSTEKIEKSAEVIACNLIEEWLKKISAGFQQPGVDLHQLKKSYILVMRVWYSLDAFIQIWPKATTLQIAAFCLRTASILVTAPLVVKIPAASPDSPIGSERAGLEAQFLFDENNKHVSIQRIALMTNREVSKLEPLEESNVYKFNRICSPEVYKSFEKEIENLVKICPDGDADFSIKKAKKCFVFDHLLTSGSHAKISVKDRYGFKWKVKFGEELHTELLATRLYMILGGRYSELKYYMPPGSTPLVLEPPEKQIEDPKAISYFYQLEDAYAPGSSKEKALQFSIMDWLLPNGIIRDARGRVLGNGIVDEKFIKQYDIKKKYIGSYYVYFKEATMSFNPPVVKKLGAAAFSGLGANQSRAARASIVFNLFLSSLDAKDDNCQMVLLYNPETGRFDRPVEYQSDLGCVMGSPLTAGEINSYDWDWLLPLHNFIGFKVKIMYYPEAWKNATFADAMWMARKIASMDIKTIEWAVAKSNWEPFVQALVIEKLKSRRNELVKVFGLEHEGVSLMPVDRLLTINMPAPDSTLDSPVLNGAIVSPKISPAVRKAEEAHPEGIFKVKNPFID